MLLTDAGFHKSAGAYLTIIKSTLSGPFWYFLGRKKTQKDAQGRKNTFRAFLVLSGTNRDATCKQFRLRSKKPTQNKPKWLQLDQTPRFKATPQKKNPVPSSKLPISGLSLRLFKPRKLPQALRLFGE
jgi:hypothetical protein